MIPPPPQKKKKQTNKQTQIYDLGSFSHLAPKYFKLVANSKKLVAIFY